MTIKIFKDWFKEVDKYCQEFLGVSVWGFNVNNQFWIDIFMNKKTPQEAGEIIADFCVLNDIT